MKTEWIPASISATAWQAGVGWLALDDGAIEWLKVLRIVDHRESDRLAGESACEQETGDGWTDKVQAGRDWLHRGAAKVQLGAPKRMDQAGAQRAEAGILIWAWQINRVPSFASSSPTI